MKILSALTPILLLAFPKAKQMVLVASKTAVVLQVVCPPDAHLRAMITDSRADDDFEVKCANDMLTLPVSGDKSWQNGILRMLRHDRNIFGNRRTETWTIKSPDLQIHKCERKSLILFK